jgi:hypothetical protein
MFIQGRQKKKTREYQDRNKTSQNLKPGYTSRFVKLAKAAGGPT